MTELNVACLGAGYFAQFHHEAWRRNPRTTLIAVADQDPAKDADYVDLDAVLQVHAPDIIDIITPPPTHVAAVKRALEARPKAIICQKPFGQNAQEAQMMAQAAKDAGVPLIIHENFRFQPWYRTMWQVLQDGTLGDVHNLTFRLRTGDGQGAEAYLARQPYFQEMPKFLIRETAVHWIDTFRYLLGPVQSVYADLRQLNPHIAGEDAGHVIFEFEDGRRAVFDGNRHLDHAAQNHRLTLGEALLEGTKGTITLNGYGLLSHRTFGAEFKSTLLPQQDWPGFAGDCVYALQDHVVAALLDGAAFENLADDYLAVVQVEEAIYTSAKEGRRVRPKGV